MKQVYVISDTHLGGLAGTGEEKDFRICTSGKTIANFIDEISSSRDEVELVINGDFVDFLAEEEFEDFSLHTAPAKLERLIQQEQDVFTALRRFLDSGRRLVITLGNHDLELCLPAVRAVLNEHLNPGGRGNYHFVYDGEAYRVGPDDLIEHGNRYDPWNVVDHDGLRKIRSAMSRGELDAVKERLEFMAPPGSKLVAKAINHIKRKYRFIDVINLPQDAIFALVLAIEPNFRPLVSEVIKGAFDARKNEPKKKDGIPRFGKQISSAVQSSDAYLRLLEAQFGLPKYEPIFGSQISSGISRLIDLGSLLLPLGDEARLGTIVRIISGVNADDDPTKDDTDYATTADHLIERSGALAVIFGHTHCARLVQRSKGLYLNSGSWVNVLRLPEGVLDGNGDPSPVSMNNFLQELKSDQIEAHCKTQHTYINCKLDVNQRLVSASLCSYPDNAIIEEWNRADFAEQGG